MAHAKERGGEWETTHVIYAKDKGRAHTLMVDDRYISGSKYFDSMFQKS